MVNVHMTMTRKIMSMPPSPRKKFNQKKLIVDTENLCVVLGMFEAGMGHGSGFVHEVALFCCYDR